MMPFRFAQLACGFICSLIILSTACSTPAQKENVLAKPNTKLPVDNLQSGLNTPARSKGEKVQALQPQSLNRDNSIEWTSFPDSLTIPDGMVFVPGGQLELGSNNGLDHEKPVRLHNISGFLMDEHPVTVGQFRAFVMSTGYQTEAEKFGDSGILNYSNGLWELQKGADWKFPQGRDFDPVPEDHPVTQVSWKDAVAYCNWAGKRLPSEAEWEHAARNGKNTRSMYSWGEKFNEGLVNQSGFGGNVWQGDFPLLNKGEDGYLYTSPVKKFGKTELGLYDMSGNVWEWCSDWYLNYGANQTNFIPDETAEKVMRGGSFLCNPSWCHGYRVSGRSGTTPETGLLHVGFRPVKDISSLGKSQKSDNLRR